MEKKRNKRGQSEWYIIGFLLAAFLLIVLVIGPGKFFLYISNLFSYAPNDLEAMKLACKGYSTGQLTSDYCTFREKTINGVKGLVNCNYIFTLAGTSADFSDIPCGTTQVADYCTQLRKGTSFNDKIIINGAVCPEK